MVNKTYELSNGVEVNIAEDYGYTFAFGGYKRALGKCDMYQKKITISKPWAVNNLQEEHILIDTVLHEIAHAIAYEMYGDGGHGKAWKMVCRLIGYTGERTFKQDRDSTVTPPKGKYQYACPSCERIHQFYRKPKRAHSCGMCSPTFKPSLVLKLVE